MAAGRHRRITLMDCIVMVCIVMVCIIMDRFVMPCPG
jgi:hypothetical protein